MIALEPILRKIKELIAVAVAVGIRCQPGIVYYVKGHSDVEAMVRMVAPDYPKFDPFLGLQFTTPFGCIKIWVNDA